MDRDDVQAEYVRSARTRFDAAFGGLAMTYANHPEDVRFLIEYWDEVTYSLSERTMDPFMGNVPDPLVYESDETGRHDIVKAMNWISFFVSHEIHDDGDPSIVWLVEPDRFKDGSTWVSVPLGTEGAVPALLRTHEVEYPHAIFLANMEPLKVAAAHSRTQDLALAEKYPDDPPREDSHTKLLLTAILKNLLGGA